MHDPPDPGGKIQATLCDYPLRLAAPVPMASLSLRSLGNVLLALSLDGCTGYGEAAPHPAYTGETPRAARRSLEGWQNRWDGRLPERLQVGTFPELGRAARACVEGALLDLAARRAGVPLCAFLGAGSPRAVQLPTSTTVPLVEPELVEHHVQAALDEGFTILKVKVGLGVEQDLDRLHRVRELAGPDVLLRVDVNGGWTRDQAHQALPELAALGIQFLEQPLPPEDLEGHAALRARDQVPIMLDESARTPQEALEALQAGALDLLNIKLQEAGGHQAARHMAALAGRFEVPCMVGCMPESRVGILHAAHLVAAHGNIWYADLDGATFLSRDPVAGGPTIQDGYLRLGTTPGLGIQGVRTQGRCISTPVERSSA